MTASNAKLSSPAAELPKAKNDIQRLALNKISTPNSLSNSQANPSLESSSLAAGQFINGSLQKQNNENSRGFFGATNSGVSISEDDSGYRKITSIGGDPDANTADSGMEFNNGNSNDGGMDSLMSQLLGGGGSGASSGLGASGAGQFALLQSGEGTPSNGRAPTIFEYASFRVQKFAFENGRVRSKLVQK